VKYWNHYKCWKHVCFSFHFLQDFQPFQHFQSQWKLRGFWTESYFYFQLNHFNAHFFQENQCFLKKSRHFLQNFYFHCWKNILPLKILDIITSLKGKKVEEKREKRKEILKKYRKWGEFSPHVSCKVWCRGDARCRLVFSPSPNLRRLNSSLLHISWLSQ